jgi:hypothetical protein
MFWVKMLSYKIVFEYLSYGTINKQYFYNIYEYKLYYDLRIIGFYILFAKTLIDINGAKNDIDLYH